MKEEKLEEKTGLALCSPKVWHELRDGIMFEPILNGLTIGRYYTFHIELIIDEIFYGYVINDYGEKHIISETNDSFIVNV